MYVRELSLTINCASLHKIHVFVFVCLLLFFSFNRGYELIPNFIFIILPVCPLIDAKIAS